MGHAKNEPLYKGTILQQNYRKMTMKCFGIAPTMQVTHVRY